MKAVLVTGRTSLPVCARVGLEDDSVGRRGREFPTDSKEDPQSGVAGVTVVEIRRHRISKRRILVLAWLSKRESAGNRPELSGPEEEPIPLPPYSSSSLEGRELPDGPPGLAGC